MKINGPGVRYQVEFVPEYIPLILKAETTQERGALRAVFYALKEALPKHAIRLEGEETGEPMSLYIFMRQLE